MPQRWFLGYSLVTGFMGLFVLIFIYFGDSGGGGILHPLNLVAIFLLFIAYGSYFFRRWIVPLLYINLLASLVVFILLVAVSGWAGSSNSGKMLWPLFILLTLCYFVFTLRLIIYSRRYRELFSAHSR